MSAGEDAATVVARALSLRAAEDRPKFLREMLAHVAAGLVIIEGERTAGETVYRLADAVVSRAVG